MQLSQLLAIMVTAIVTVSSAPTPTASQESSVYLKVRGRPNCSRSDTETENPSCKIARYILSSELHRMSEYEVEGRPNCSRTNTDAVNPGCKIAKHDIKLVQYTRRGDTYIRSNEE